MLVALQANPSIAAAALGDVEAMLGQLHHLRPGCQAWMLRQEREAGKPDRTGSRDRAAVTEIEIATGNRKANPFGDALRLAAVGGARHQQKFFAAPADQIIRLTEYFPQPFTDLHQHHIASRVTILVVDHLEMV